MGVGVGLSALRSREGEVIPAEKARREFAEVELQGKVLNPGWTVAGMPHEVGGRGAPRDLKQIARVRQAIAECEKLRVGGSGQNTEGERRRQDRRAHSLLHALFSLVQTG